MSEVKKRGLGRGFDSLIPTGMVEAEFDVTAKVDDAGHRTSGDVIREVDPNLVDPNPHQPRQNFDPDALEALAASIRVHGILQPLVMSQIGSRFELIAGERRLRAAKLAGFDRVPAIIRSFDEQTKLELAIIENIQRAELNPLELATAYKKLMDQFNQSYEDIGKKVGRDFTTIANVVRLLNLPIECKHALVAGEISEGHCRAILALREEHKQLELLALIQKNKWNVRQAEEFARGYKGEQGSKMMAQARINEIEAWAKDLGDYLGTKVQQQRQAKGRGKIIIEYYSQEELDRIYSLIRHNQQ
jgi:ParB family transcriptional regulator, chromosome partitioning protein